MDRVTLNYEQLVSFTGWTANYARKQNPEKKKEHLENMGMQEVIVEGKGKKATFTFIIPTGFWKLVLIPSMGYSELAADYVKYLIEGRDIDNTAEGSLVKFNTEIYEELAKKYNADYEAVKTTCRRIREHLLTHDYIRNNAPGTAKSHRVKDNRTGDWVVGAQAIIKDKQARDIWISFSAHFLLSTPLIYSNVTINHPLCNRNDRYFGKA